MATAVIELQTRFLNIAEREFQRKDGLQVTFNQTHQVWQTAVTTRITAINASLVAAGLQGNHTDLNLAIAAYNAGLGINADPNLVAPLPEPVFNYVLPELVALVRDYALVASSLGICGLAASMLQN